jgi:hypothetical protein
MRTTGRWLAAAVLCFGVVVVGGLPAWGQVDNRQVDSRYAGVTSPVIPVGGVLTSTGQRTGTGQAVATEVLSSQAGQTTQAGRAPVQGLALTGADVMGLVAVGISLTTVGIIIAHRARPRSAPEA